MPKLELWTKINKDGFQLSENNKIRLYSFREKTAGQDIKMTLETKKGSKSEEALSYYFGGLLPAIISHNRNLTHKGAIENNPLILSELCRTKKITADEIEDMHRSIMVSFRPTICYDIKTKQPQKIGEELKNYNNEKLGKLITEVIDYMSDQGYEIPDNELAKKIRDSAMTHEEYELSAKI